MNLGRVYLYQVVLYGEHHNGNRGTYTKLVMSDIPFVTPFTDESRKLLEAKAIESQDQLSEVEHSQFYNYVGYLTQDEIDAAARPQRCEADNLGENEPE